MVVLKKTKKPLSKWLENSLRPVAPQDEQGVRNWNPGLDDAEKNLEKDYEKGRR